MSPKLNESDDESTSVVDVENPSDVPRIDRSVNEAAPPKVHDDSLLCQTVTVDHPDVPATVIAPVPAKKPQRKILPIPLLDRNSAFFKMGWDVGPWKNILLVGETGTGKFRRQPSNF